MSTLNRFIDDLSEKSGCDWNFLIDMYNHIEKEHGEVDWERFYLGVVNHDWKKCGREKMEDALLQLSKASGYTYEYLFDLYVDMVYDPMDDVDWEYFEAVSMEHDW